MCNVMSCTLKFFFVFVPISSFFFTWDNTIFVTDLNHSTPLADKIKFKRCY